MRPVFEEPVPGAVRPKGVDLLSYGPIARLTLWPAFPYVFQALTLGMLATLAVLGWGHMPPSDVPDKLYAKANLVNLVVWGLFWPAIVWATVLLGRVWCTVCPLELVSNVSERVGRRLGIRQGSVPGWMRAGWLMVALYAVLQLLVAGLHIHRVPSYTSVFLWTMLAAAAVSGSFLKDRAYCRGLCPVAPLLKVYGRGGMLAVRPAGKPACEACQGKTCAVSELRNQLDGRSCPTLLNPETLSSSEDCLLCGQCLKSCKPGNMRALIRPLFAGADQRRAIASGPVTLFVFFVSGFVTSEVASEWAAATEVFLAPVGWVVKTFAIGQYSGWVEGVWTIGVFPALLWLALAGLVILFRGAATIGEAARRIALPLAIVIAAGQMAKGLAKFVSWAGFLPIVWSSPDGASTSIAMAKKTMAQPLALLRIEVVAAVGVVLVMAATWFAAREFRLANQATRFAWLTPVATVASVYGFVVAGWGLLQ